jgi:hypothetical protein
VNATATIVYFAAVISVFLHVALAIVLVRKYFRTKDVGFLWLGAAVVIWPPVSRLLDLGWRYAIDHVVNHEWGGLYPFSLVEHGRMTLGELTTCFTLLEQLVGVSLLFLSILYLSKTKSSSNLRSAT